MCLDLVLECYQSFLFQIFFFFFLNKYFHSRIFINQQVSMESAGITNIHYLTSNLRCWGQLGLAGKTPRRRGRWSSWQNQTERKETVLLLPLALRGKQTKSTWPHSCVHWFKQKSGGTTKSKSLVQETLRQKWRVSHKLLYKTRT